MALIKIHQVKLFWNPAKVIFVNIHKVFNTQDEENNYFSNFNLDTKLAFLDNSVNINIWNCLKDFLKFIRFTEEDMREHMRIIGEGSLPIGCGDVPIIYFYVIDSFRLSL